MSADPMEETTTEWRELSEPRQALAVVAYCSALKVGISRRSEMHRIFELGQPIMVFGPKDTYCRIHSSSTAVMKILFDNYL